MRRTAWAPDRTEPRPAGVERGGAPYLSRAREVPLTRGNPAELRIVERRVRASIEPDVEGVEQLRAELDVGAAHAVALEQREGRVLDGWVADATHPESGRAEIVRRCAREA